MSLFDELLKRATTSVVPQAKEGYDMLANVVDPGPSLSDADHPYKAMIRGGAAGMLNGFGKLADSTTSPLGLATMAAGGVGKLVGSVGKAGAAMSEAMPEVEAVASAPASVEDQLFLENMRRQQLSSRLSPVRFGEIPPTRDQVVNMMQKGAAARGR